MLKNKYLIVAGIGLGMVVLGGGGFAVWHDLAGHRQLGSLQSASANVDGAGQASSDTGSSAIGLNVAPSTVATDLGQLGGSQAAQGSATTGNGSSAGASSGSYSVPKALDPSTFSQYDKYKGGATALFGDLQVGTGATLGAGQQAAVYYRGWLTNGQLFDQSKAGSDGQLQPFAFTLGQHQVIAGWEQGLSGMKVGGVRLLIVPPAVGYGATGQGSIPPNSVLVFQVQLLGVQ